MPKRRSNTEITVIIYKKLLKDITGIDKDLGLKTTADKGCQTEQIEIVEEDFFEDETNHDLLLELIAKDLESSDIIIESVDGDQVTVLEKPLNSLLKNCLSK